MTAVCCGVHCPFCYRPILSRQHRTCGYCERNLPDELLASAEWIAGLKAELAEIEARRIVAEEKEASRKEARRRNNDGGGYIAYHAISDGGGSSSWTSDGGGGVAGADCGGGDCGC